VQTKTPLKGVYLAYFIHIRGRQNKKRKKVQIKFLRCLTGVFILKNILTPQAEVNKTLKDLIT
jgi:hypothetical protein